MTQYLKPDVHAVAIGRDLALLDLINDTYLCLPDGAGALPRGSDAALLSGPATKELEDAGLLTGVPSARRRAIPSLPVRTIIHLSASPRLRLAAIVASLGVPVDIARARRGDGLVAYLRAADASMPLSRDPDVVAAAARLFWQIGPWLPIEGECLVRSAMLVAFLRRMGLAADWVFGVRLWPFAAHCWVQSGDACLNDDVERLWAYTPIYCR